MPARSVAKRRDEALAWLKARGSKVNVDGMARYGIKAKKVLGVSVGTIRGLGKKIGKDHELAEALWKTGWHEAKFLASFIDDPALVTPAQMDRWARSFENWADTDTVCFCLFDRTPHAWGRVRAWSRRKGEFEKRAAFALIASMALHDKRAPDAPFMKSLALIERAATDERNFVKKGVSWALRHLGHRSGALHSLAVKTATTLSKSADVTERWVGRDALRDITRPAVLKKVAKATSRRR